MALQRITLAHTSAGLRLAVPLDHANAGLNMAFMTAVFRYLLCYRESKTALGFEGGFDSLSAGELDQMLCQTVQVTQDCTSARV